MNKKEKIVNLVAYYTSFDTISFWGTPESEMGKPKLSSISHLFKVAQADVVTGDITVFNYAFSNWDSNQILNDVGKQTKEIIKEIDSIGKADNILNKLIAYQNLNILSEDTLLIGTKSESNRNKKIPNKWKERR